MKLRTGRGLKIQESARLHSWLLFTSGCVAAVYVLRETNRTEPSQHGRHNAGQIRAIVPRTGNWSRPGFSDEPSVLSVETERWSDGWLSRSLILLLCSSAAWRYYCKARHNATAIMSVCLSIRPSHLWSVSKLLNLSSNIFAVFFLLVFLLCLLVWYVR